MLEELKTKLRELLKNKQVDLLIGYQRASNGISAAPCFVENEKDLDLLIWDAYCLYNLSNYLKDYPAKKIAIVVKECDLRSIIVLLQENQLKRENLFIIAMECLGVIDQRDFNFSDTEHQEICFAEKCKNCRFVNLFLADYVIKDKREKKESLDDYDAYGSIRKMEAKALAERSKFWQDEFSRCIRCYACRQICPMCYCPRCVAEQAQPAWFSQAANFAGNFSWNITRAMHLAGRCIDCGECERACPVGIPLRDLNKKIEKDVKELFKYEAGLNTDAKPLFSCFDKCDPGEWIK